LIQRALNIKVNLKKYKYTIPIIILFAFSGYYVPPVTALIIGMLIILYSASDLYILVYMQKNGKESVGEILDIVSVEGADNNIDPLIEFETNNGKKIKGIPYMYSPEEMHYKGKLKRFVDVLYDEKHPYLFIVNNIDVAFQYFVLGFAMLIGFLIFIFGILWLFGNIHVENYSFYFFGFQIK